MSVSAFAAPHMMTFRALILKPDGNALESNNVTFRFFFMDALGTCSLYQEDHLNVDMTDSGGAISISLGDPLKKTFPVVAMTLQDIFNLGTALGCNPSGSVTPGATLETGNL